MQILHTESTVQVHGKDDRGRSAFWLAVLAGRAEIVKLLADAGALIAHTLCLSLTLSLSLSVSVCLSHPLSVSLISVCVCLSGALLEEEAADGSPALFAACASLALAPLPLILSDNSEKSLCGTGAMPAIQRWHRRCSRWAATQRRSRAPPRARSIVVARCGPLCLPLSVSASLCLCLCLTFSF